MPAHDSSAEQITRASKSNLAFAFISLGKKRRRDITIFYAFCRLIDDIADSPDLSPEEKARQLVALERWSEAVSIGPESVDALAGRFHDGSSGCQCGWQRASSIS